MAIFVTNPDCLQKYIWNTPSPWSPPLVLPLTGMDRRKFAIQFSAACLLASFFLTLTFIAAKVQIDYFDVFNTLSNAKTIAYGQGPYEIRRFLFPSLIHAPWFWIESHFQWEGLGFRASHLMNILFFVAWMGIVLNIYRKRLSAEWALGGVIALAFLPLFIHYAPSAKEDLLSALLVWGAFAFYFRRQYIYAGLTSGFAIASRYNLLVLLSVFFVLHGFLRKEKRPLLPLLSVSATVFLGLPLIIYPFIHHSSLSGALPDFLWELTLLYRHHYTGFQPYFIFFQFLNLGLALPLLTLVAWAITCYLRAKKRDEVFEFHALWALVYVAYHAFFQPGKEVRYLFPVLPSLVFLAFSGLHAISWRWARVAILSLLIVHGGIRAGKEFLKYLDPFYFTAFEKQVSLRAKAIAENGKIYWLGKYYGMHPKEAVLHPEDHYGYLYHFHSHVVRFFSERPVQEWMGDDYILPVSGEKRKWISVPGVGAFAKSGDVFIINTDEHNTLTEDITPTLPPLYIQRIRLFSTIKGIPDGIYEWYGRETASSPWKFSSRVQISGEKIVTQPKPFRENLFLDFDLIETF